MAGKWCVTVYVCGLAELEVVRVKAIMYGCVSHLARVSCVCAIVGCCICMVSSTRIPCVQLGMWVLWCV